MKLLSPRLCGVVLALALGVAGPGMALRVVYGQAAATATADAQKAAIEHYTNARKLFDQDKYAEAQKEVAEALRLDPELSEAKLLQSRIEIRLSEQPGAGKTPGGNGGGGAAAKGTLLSPEDITLLRFHEMKYDIDSPDMSRVTGTIPRKVLEDFWKDVVLKEAGGETPTEAQRNRFLSPTNLNGQLRRMHDANVPDINTYVSKLKISNEPQAFITFRQKVQPYLLQSCSKCHNNPDNNFNGYRIWGTATGRPGDAETYTNFYMMTRYIRGTAQMLDRDKPDRSLFLQYGIQRKNAGIPHPKVEVARFANENDASFREMVDWVKSLAYPKPNYGVSWVPPASATAPAATTPGQ